jgi:hypothetical protein
MIADGRRRRHILHDPPSSPSDPAAASIEMRLKNALSYFFAAQGLPFAAHGLAGFLAFGPHGLEDLLLGAQGLAPLAAAGTAVAPIMPLTAAIAPRVCSDFFNVVIHHLLGLKDRRAS